MNKKLRDYNGFVMACPLSIHPSKPDDLPNCYAHECPICKELCWMTDNKIFLAENDDMFLSCMICLIKKADEENFDFDMESITVKMNELH